MSFLDIKLSLQCICKVAIIFIGIFYFGICAENEKSENVCPKKFANGQCSERKMHFPKSHNHFLGFLLTVPNTLYANSIENLCLSLQNIFDNGSITIKLLNAKNVIASTTHLIIRGQSSCFEFFIPMTSITIGTVRVQGKFDGITYTIQGEANVAIKKVSTMTFIETDKQLYKPGQKVLFRIFRLTSSLLPVLVPVSEVWINNPSAIRVAQWKAPPTINGITDLSFELSNEPQLGKWLIHLKDGNRNMALQSFTVQEYVLPKFKVEITTPKVLLTNMQNFTCKVCAHYTYGQPVRGKLEVAIKLQLDSFHFYHGLFNGIPNVLYNGTFDALQHGCQEITIVNKFEEHKFDISSSFGSFRRGMLSLFSYNINFYVIVTEGGTETKMNSSKTQMVFDKPFKLEFSSKSYFKPGMPYFGKILVKHHDGSPAVKESIMLDVESQNSTNLTYFSNELGEVNFMIKMEKSSRNIHLKASSIVKPDLNQVSYYQTLKSWYSPSQSFLQIEPLPGVIPCDAGTVDLQVHFTTGEQASNGNINLYYQVMARGKLLFQKASASVPDITDKNKSATKSVILPLIILPQMSPLAHILVYYVRNDGEIVSDSQEIIIAKCFQNEVNMSFNETEILPGTFSSIRISARPGSVCALNVVDKSAHVLASNNLIDIEKVFATISKSYPKEVTTSTLNQCHHQSYGYGYHSINSEPHQYTETDKAFHDVGLVTISDLHFRTPPCLQKPQPYYPDYYLPPPPPPPGINRGMPGLAVDAISVTGLQSYSGPINGRPMPPQSPPRPPVQTLTAVEIRDYFPETWLWELHHLGVNGSVLVKREIPHSITTWIGMAFCLSDEKGLGVSRHGSIRAFQPFFLSVTMPYSVKKGEVIPIIASVFNYLSDCIPVKIFLEESDNYTLVSNSSNAHACICGQTSYSHKFWIRPSSFGLSNITVYAHSINGSISKICEEGFANVVARDAITKTILVKAHGFPKEFSNTLWICPHEHPDQVNSQKYHLSLPKDVIKGSARAFVSVIGDLMGPSIQGLESLVKLPVGCGEQNLVLFAPNIYVLQYLNNSNQLTDFIEQKAVNHLKTGYQRQLNYRHRDGSYSAFGGKDSSGSIWLTSFVIKSFAQAKPLIYINLEELDKSIQFIHKNQMSNGCFRATGVVLSKSMQGGLGGQTSHQSLAAYIIIALLEAGTKPTANIVNRAFQCLQHDDPKKNIYLLAMKAYAATLAKRDDLSVFYLKQLYQHATRKGDMLFWTNSDSKNSVAEDIEITSYALLSLVTRNSPEEKSDALSIVRWLTEQRNSHGGFVSTQDTILALQAIAKYASLINVGNVSMEVILAAHAMEEFSFQVNDDNKLLLQTKRIPILPTDLAVTGVGLGCAMIQLTTKYNVMNNGPMDAFHLGVRISPSPTTCVMNICARYLLADEKSNMAVIEIQMLSGYEADANSLDKLQNDIDVQLKRWEISTEGSINLYFEEITKVKKCFGFNIIGKHNVQERKPAIVKLYDYYEPELSVSQKYTLQQNALCNEPSLDVEGTIY